MDVNILVCLIDAEHEHGMYAWFMEQVFEY